MKKALLKFINFWPPFLGAGICVKHMSKDFRRIEVEMKLRFWNQNYVGTHFGGSLFTMVDPFFMLMLLENMGNKYIIWDKAATIRFENPGRTKVHAIFNLTEDEIITLRKQADEAEGKIEPIFTVEIRDEADLVIAVIEKKIYIRRKDSIKPKEIQT